MSLESGMALCLDKTLMCPTGNRVDFFLCPHNTQSMKKACTLSHVLYLLNSQMTVMIPTVVAIMTRRDKTTPPTAPPTSLLRSPASSVIGVDSDDEGGGEGAVVCVVFGVIVVCSGGVLGEAIN